MRYITETPTTNGLGGTATSTNTAVVIPYGSNFDAVAATTAAGQGVRYITETPTPSMTATMTSSITPSYTRTKTFTRTPSNTRTKTFTRTPSNTRTKTFTHTPSNTRTSSRTKTLTRTPSYTSTNTITLTPSITPTLLPYAIKKISMGSSFGLGLKADGTLISWGNAKHGESVIPTYLQNQYFIDIATGPTFSVAVDQYQRVHVWGSSRYTVTDLPNEALQDVIAVDAGTSHIIALKTDGSVIAWGRNNYHQIDVPATVTNVIAISAGGDYSLALKSDGTVIGWGGSLYSAMIVPSNLTNVIAISVGEDHALALKDDGTVVGWGNNRYNQISVPYNKDRNIVAIAAGLNYSLALTNTGKIVGWGDNTFKRYTVPNIPNDVIAITASYANSVVSLRTGQLRIYGAPQSNALITRTPTINGPPLPTATPP